MKALTARELAFRVKEMRDAQKAYFKLRTTLQLEAAKKLEREVDKAVARLIKYGGTGDLFEDAGDDTENEA